MLSIIIPAFKEHDNLVVLIPRITEILKDKIFEIIIVDDNSGDGTKELISETSRKNPIVKLLIRKEKFGLTSAIVEGVAFSKGEDILVMDADLSHPPEKINEFFDALNDFDLVVGSRNLPGGGVEDWPVLRKIISWGASTLAKLLLGVKIGDPMSGFFAIKKNVFMKTRFRINGYKILLNILADNKNIRIKEIPYLFKNRFVGTSKLGMKEMLIYLSDLIKIKLG